MPNVLDTMRTAFMVTIAVFCFTRPGNAADAPHVEVIRLADAGVQPQIAIDDKGFLPIAGRSNAADPGFAPATGRQTSRRGGQ